MFLKKTFFLSLPVDRTSIQIHNEPSTSTSLAYDDFMGTSPSYSPLRHSPGHDYNPGSPHYVGFDDEEEIFEPMFEEDNEQGPSVYELFPSDEENEEKPPECTSCMKRFPKYRFKPCGHGAYCVTCMKRNEYLFEYRNMVHAKDCPQCQKPYEYEKIFY